MQANEVSISSFMSEFCSEEKYEIKGNRDTLFSGLHAALARHRDGLFFVVADKSWPKALLKRQQDISIEKLIQRALSKGFDSFIVPSEYKDTVISIKGVKSLVVIDDTWPFFLDVSSYIREKSGCKVFAVTGSAGKTSTCDMLKLALKDEYDERLYVPEGINSNLFRDSVSSLSRLFGYEAAILEVSASKQFAKSNFFVSPDVAIFTALSEAHAQYLGSIKDIAITKSTLFNGMPVDGRIVLNLDMPCSDVVCEIAKLNVDNVITYGESDAADVKLVAHDLKIGTAEVSYFGKNIVFKTNLKSKHMLLNSVAVITSLCNTELDWESVSNKLLSFLPSKGRGAIHGIKIKGKSLTIVDESYNSNLASVKASLDSLSGFETSSNGKRIAILGDMLELGDASKSLHKKLAALINDSSVDKVILIGNDVAEAWGDIELSKKIALLPDTKSLFTILRNNSSDGDVVLFKASNAIGLGKVVNRLLKV